MTEVSESSKLTNGRLNFGMYAGAHLEYLNKEVRGRKHKKDDETILTVRTELAALKHETSDLSVGLRLLDTPGPNEAGEEALK